MSTPPSQDTQEILAALQRLVVQHQALTREEALAAARQITGDENVQLPGEAQPGEQASTS